MYKLVLDKDISLLIKNIKWPIIYGIISLIYCSLFVFYKYLPLQDVPNHLLESTVILYPEKFTPYYGIRIIPVPYLAGQLFLALIGKFTGILVAARLFFVLYSLLFGVFAYYFTKIFFNKAFNVGLVFFLFLPNFFFWKGYMNFTLSVPLCMLFLAISHKNKTPLWMDVLFSVIVYFTHFFSMAVFMLYKLIELLFKKKIKHIVILCLPVSILSILYIVLSPNDVFWIKYGDGLWKIASIKRLLGIPYVSNLTNKSIFDLLNIYNATIYSGFIGIVIYSIYNFKLIISQRIVSRIYIYFLFALGVVYLVHPTHLGRICDADNRIAFFWILFFVPIPISYLLKKNSHLQKKFLILITGVIFSGILNSFAQFHLSQKRLIDIVDYCARLDKSKDEKIYVMHTNKLDSMATSNKIYKVLGTIRLNTETSQVALLEEHAESYFYLDGGYPRRLSTVSLIKKMQ